MLDAGGRVAARLGPWSEPATTTPEVLASVLSTISRGQFRRSRGGTHRPEYLLPVAERSVTLGRMTPHQAALEIVELDADDPAAVDAAYRLSNIGPVPELPPNCRYKHD